MALYVYNLTGAPVVLAAGNPARTIPASTTPPTRVDVTSELRGLTGPDYTALEAQRAGTLVYEWTSDPEYAVGTLTVEGPAPGLHKSTHAAGGSDALAVDNQTAVNQPLLMASPAHIDAPIAAELVSIVAQVAMADGAQVLAGQPDYPRKLQVDIVDADASVTAGTLDIVGVGAGGDAINESVDLTGGTATKDTTYAYATITSATIVGLAGATGADLVSVGVGSALGMPVPLAAASFAVAKTVVDAADETVAGVDTTAKSINPTTAPNGAHVYDFFYRYSMTPTQTAHSHTLS